MPRGNRRIADGTGPDFYPTPESATCALLDNETFTGTVWEPACGDGAMVEVIKRYGHAVVATDLYDRGYGDSGVDFTALRQRRRYANIITNPPFNLAEQFVDAGLHNCRSKLALLLRLSFLESAKRYKTIYSRVPPTRVWVFSQRITFYPNGVQTAGSGTIAYAWFIWDKRVMGVRERTELRWLPPRD